MKYASPGDIILFKYKNEFNWKHPISRLVSWIQGNPITHSAILIDSENDIIIDSYWPRVRKIYLNEIILDGAYEWIAVRPIDSTKEQRQKVAEIASSYIGIEYDLESWTGLLKAFILEKLIGIFIRDKLYLPDHPDKVFCQELVTQCYMTAGFDLAKRMGFKDSSAIVPKDVYNAKYIFENIETSKY